VGGNHRRGIAQRRDLNDVPGRPERLFGATPGESSRQGRLRGRHCSVDVTRAGAAVRLEAEVIIDFTGRACLARAVGDPACWMGQPETDDQTIRCWGQYSSDLGEAFLGL
jgi:hypothetical protein